MIDLKHYYKTKYGYKVFMVTIVIILSIKVEHFFLKELITLTFHERRHYELDIQGGDRADQT